jgi:hypothetical protein
VTASAAHAGLADDLETVLAAVAAQLLAGDVVAAASAVKDLVACCQAVNGQHLNADQVTRLRAMLDQCSALASTTQGELNVAMQQFGVGGRARKAYGDY